MFHLICLDIHYGSFDIGSVHHKSLYMYIQIYGNASVRLTGFEPTISLFQLDALHLVANVINQYSHLLFGARGNVVG
jgi:hypothetical protein